ncbi:leucine--tRNA ligase [Candidatus Woesearchaeota archaeon]|nr:MAG: leucine--tRNA ligase [Candidatus Woesearchaeota archaeon]
MNQREIEKKWQKVWNDKKVFEPEVDGNKPKFLLTFPYPYINAFPHIGHLYTIMRVEAFTRYKKLKGFNVLFPQGWHATGSPIVNAAERVKDREEKQIKIMKDMGFDDSEMKKFENPEYWIDYFAPECEKDYRDIGLSIDWRRKFTTTSVNPHYDKFIRWQFNKLKEGGFVKKGKFPVVWCEKDNGAVGDHARVEGEGETTQEFCLFKFKRGDGSFVVSATLRPDTLMGITNVYVNPKEEYFKIETNGETWIVGNPVIEKLKRQEYEIEEKGKIFGKDLLGEDVTFPVGNIKIPILPATFLDSNYGTGIVHSVPSDSADDLIALQNIQENDKVLDEFGLDKEKVKAIKPIEIFNTPEIGGNSAQYFLDKYKVKSQNQRDLLEKIKKELYKLTFTQSTFNEKYSEFDLVGIKIEEGQEKIKNQLLKNGAINLFYELTGKVVCRCLTPSVVKIVSDQWFLDYGDENWKELAHKCLNNMKLYPEKARQQFNYVIDWLHKWACTREEGLGTRLPWDEKWLIESLSDSTIYMAYYTIAHIIQTLNPNELNDEFFDYMFKNMPYSDNIKVSKEKAEDMKKEFEYWYPVDFRNSGKDLIQNHLTFFIFNHVAIFDEKYWPKGIGANGWVTVDGEKMSKSKGNMISLRDMVKEFSADASRITILNGGESMDDPNWDSGFAKTIMSKIESFFDSFDKTTIESDRTIDRWAESELNRIIKESTEYMEDTSFRSAIQKIFFEMQNLTKWYLARTNNTPGKIFEKIRDATIIMMSPFTAHICEEYWEKYVNQGLVADAAWPEFDESKIDLEIDLFEKTIETTVKDINSVKKLSGIDKPKKVTIIISKSWKYEYFNKVKSLLVETRNIGDILKSLMNEDSLKKYGQEISKMTPKIVSTNRVPQIITSPEKEKEIFNQSLDYFKETFKCHVEIIFGDEFDNPKSNNAIPGKPAIILE